MEYIIIFLICTISGFLTGLLSVGGGIVIVPLFLAVLPFWGIEMPLLDVIGISTTCVLINSSVTAFYRRKEKKLPVNTILPLMLSIITGTLFGAFVSDFIPELLILSVFVIVSLCSIYFINGEIYFDLAGKKTYPLLYFVFALIGAISATIGIGGAVFFVTALKCFLAKDTKELLPTITILVLCHAIFAFLGKFALGHVPLYIIPLAFIASIIGSKAGVIISKKLSSRTLNQLLSIILILGLVKIIHEFFI